MTKKSIKHKRDPAFYLNENIPIHLVDTLAKFKIKAIHTLNVNNGGASDKFQLEYAASRNYVLVSHNRKHFRYLHQTWIRKKKIHSGIIVMGHGDPAYLARRICKFLEQIYPKITPPFCEVPPSIIKH